MLFQAAGVLILYMEVEYLQITVSSTIKIEKNLSSTHQKINMTLTIQSSKNWKETTYHHRWTFDGFHLATGAMGGISYVQVTMLALSCELMQYDNILAYSTVMNAKLGGHEQGGYRQIVRDGQIVGWRIATWCPQLRSC